MSWRGGKIEGFRGGARWSGGIDRPRAAAEFDDLDPQAAAKVATAVFRLEQGNTSNVKWLGGGLGEYRIDWGPGIGCICVRMATN